MSLVKFKFNDLTGKEVIATIKFDSSLEEEWICFDTEDTAFNINSFLVYNERHFNIYQCTKKLQGRWIADESEELPFEII